MLNSLFLLPMAAGLASGILHLRLDGERLHDSFVLVSHKHGKSGREWLLIKQDERE